MRVPKADCAQCPLSSSATIEMPKRSHAPRPPDSHGCPEFGDSPDFRRARFGDPGSARKAALRSPRAGRIHEEDRLYDDSVESLSARVLQKEHEVLHGPIVPTRV